MNIDGLAGRIRDEFVFAVGPYAEANGAPETQLGDARSIIYYSSKVEYTFSGQRRLGCKNTTNPFAWQGSYLHYKDGHATLAPLNFELPVVMSGNFSGCEYHVYRSKDKPDDFICAHISRSSGSKSEVVVEAMVNAAKGKNWDLVQKVETKGRVAASNGKINGICILTQLDHNRHVETVRMDLDNMGYLVGVTYEKADC